MNYESGRGHKRASGEVRRGSEVDEVRINKITPALTYTQTVCVRVQGKGMKQNKEGKK